MSWDIVLFNSRQKIKMIEDLDENRLEQTDFCLIFEKHFDRIAVTGKQREIK